MANLVHLKAAKAGTELKSNKWKLNQDLFVSPEVAEKFVKRGYAKYADEKEVEVKEVKPKNIKKK